MRSSLKTGLLLGGGLVIALVLSGCQSGAPPVSSPGGPIRVVASISVYGDIAQAIGGKAVAVTSIISSPAQDPHTFEANARTLLTLSRADLVIENGGGYDDFVDTLLNGLGGRRPEVLNAVAISGYKTTGGSFNEHVWYDFATVRKVAARVAQALSAKDPASASAFAANLATFDASLTRLVAQEAAIRTSSQGLGVAITEPVPLYLLNAVGLVDKTPKEFSRAVEAGTGVAPSVLRATLDLFRSGAVRLLVYNEQTADPETHQVIAAALASKVPVVGVTETLPPGEHYFGWMSGNLDRVAAAVK
ncbi:MAG: metal ABC transporter solute-binding protein, Zn/Mn family [Microbacteriaceae bacterium]